MLRGGFWGEGGGLGRWFDCLVDGGSIGWAVCSLVVDLDMIDISQSSARNCVDW